jgi:uncharacterized protein (TIGR00369 family)
VIPANPDWEADVRASFARQGMMETLGARIEALEPGRCRIVAPIRPETAQQHGYAHAGLGWTIGDSAAGYSALSLLGKGWEVLTIEMKINLLAPAAGRMLIAQGRVLRPGRRLVVVVSDLHAEAEDGARRHVATMLGTMFPVAPEGGTAPAG